MAIILILAKQDILSKKGQEKNDNIPIFVRSRLFLKKLPRLAQMKTAAARELETVLESSRRLE